MRVLLIVASRHGLKAVASGQGQIVRTGHATGTVRVKRISSGEKSRDPGAPKSPAPTFGGLMADKS